jgi:hypothetical protein
MTLKDLMLVMPNADGPVIINQGNLILDNTVIQGNNNILSVISNQGNGSVLIKNENIIR